MRILTRFNPILFPFPIFAHSMVHIHDVVAVTALCRRLLCCHNSFQYPHKVVDLEMGEFIILYQHAPFLGFSSLLLDFHLRCLNSYLTHPPISISVTSSLATGTNTNLDIIRVFEGSV